ncbi:hypothetical protein Lcho_2358 [Leptothrix cholodnii SP-6]|uniref:SH3 type 3 domain protein n=1 Tax=Leptothrix cholodnii (strain ATCC 51168 / LMG 8142 / SP-6) TaxID=395495 RepID=B1Y4R0_LEPCP|nr:hypothetical protein [Leptothrix cholodnii]ACB34623.1 hypothetical protein Lcho_2358 [Leptothrix cholodnii SP-6]
MNAITLLRLAAMLLLLIGSLGARAGGRLPCQEARVFGEAAVNAFVLPYRDARSDTQPHGSASWRLPALIQQEVLMSLLKYGSVGVVEVTQNGTAVCDVREVIARATQGTGSGRLKPGHGLVLIWGRIYEDGPQLYVQSYLRFLRRDEADAITVALPARTGPPLLLDATLPAQAVAMPPRRISQKDIREIEAQARKALVLHDRPDPNANPQPFVTDPETPFSYGVTKTNGDWMYITTLGRGGWVRVRNEASGWSLRRFLPELAYLDAVAGYLRLRAARVVPLTVNPVRLMGHVDAGFAEFDQAVGADAAPDARALARAMRGLLQWQADAIQPTDESRRSAALAFAEAASLTPESPMLRNLAAVSAPYRTLPIKTGAEALAEVDAGLLGALALDGGNPLVLRNLERVYDRLAAEEAQTVYDAQELKRRQVLVRAVPRSGTLRN